MLACRRALETNRLFIKKGVATMVATATLPSSVVRMLWTNSRHTMRSLTSVTRISLL